MHPAFTGWRSYTLVEPPFMMLLFSDAITGTVLTDLIIFRSCRIMLGTQNDDCNLLHTNSSSDRAMELEALVQPHASYILTCKSFVEGLVPVFLSFFLGSWSDVYGRKPLLVVGYTGLALSAILQWILCTMDIDPWLYLLGSLPFALMGGICSIIVATFSYITDIRSDNERAWHLTWLEIAISFALFLGTLIGRVIYVNFGNTAIFATAAASSTIAAFYVILFVPESIQCTTQGSWCSLFKLSLVKDLFVTCTRKREGFDRFIVWCCIATLCLRMLIMVGEISVEFLFTSARLGWDVETYSLYSASAILLTIIGTICGTQLSRIFIDKNMEDLLIAILGNVSSFAGSMTKAATRKPWHYYFSSGLGMFGALSSPLVRTALSRTVEPHDVGKVFALTTSMESVVQLVASPLYNIIYTFNMSYYPAPIYLLSAGLFAIMIIILVCIDLRLPKRRIVCEAE